MIKVNDTLSIERGAPAARSFSQPYWERDIGEWKSKTRAILANP